MLGRKYSKVRARMCNTEAPRQMPPTRRSTHPLAASPYDTQPQANMFPGGKLSGRLPNELQPTLPTVIPTGESRRVRLVAEGSWQYASLFHPTPISGDSRGLPPIPSSDVTSRPIIQSHQESSRPYPIKAGRRTL